MSRMACAWSSDRSKRRHQVRAGVVDLLRLADGLDDRVEVVERDLEAFEDVRPRARLVELELGAPADDLAPVLEVVHEHAACSGSVCGWPSTSASMFTLNASCIGVCLYRWLSTVCGLASRLSSMYDAHPVAVGLVAQVADAVDPLVLDELGDLLEEGRLVDLVRQLRHDDGWSRSPLTSSNATCARITTRPRPSAYAGGSRRPSPIRRSAAFAGARSGRSPPGREVRAV